MDKNKITEKIIDICYEKKISISKLEKDLNFSNGYISSTRNREDFPFKRLISISKYLNVPIWYFDEELKQDVSERLLKVL